MKINTFKHFIADALKNLKRNQTMSTASAATVAATLFILGLFMLTILNIRLAMKDVESQVEIKVFLKEDIKIDEQKDLESTIKGTAGVVEVKFESQTEALENLKNRLGEQYKSLLEGLDKENPMPSSYIIKVDKPESVSKVVDTIKDKPGIEVIKDGKEVVQKIIAITSAVRWVGIVIFVILIGVSLFLIGNTIKLTVYARRREIGIMKYIGATDWFIRWPFILEGMFIGILGALASSVLLYYGYRYIFVKMSTQLMMVQFIEPNYVFNTMLGEFVLGGVVIGILGSIMAIRKFLAV
ncbi:permease-like cell division protein FtsX [Clostridium sp. SYSU_GA19001]|uniref:permease-like cell division protein FtsX n=1 Tax=Clostridium caldaquaticum TaxID=2940653 RepID=UPI0020776EE6|nr:permease-like cell division protein FtsX [Clostridium caldaquaticum]MCM8710171.1 permease-like cell division protein FtsX [Clostridium caldaquaticum]